MSDGQGAVGKLNLYLNKLGIEVDISGAGGHVARIERRIQMIKERARAHICGRIPFQLTKEGLSMLILYCVSRINYQYSGSRPGGMTTRKAFTGRRVNALTDFRVSFGDYVHCTVPSTNITMKSRTEACIVMLPTGYRTGSVRMLSLETGKIVTRDNFLILPMPQHVINTLNTMALKDGRKVQTGTVPADLLYQQSVNSDSLPTFITLQPDVDGVASKHVTVTKIPVTAVVDIIGNAQSAFSPEKEEGIVESSALPTEKIQTEESITEHGEETHISREAALTVFSRSAVSLVTDFLRDRSGNGMATNTSNVSVKEALRTNKVEAKRVISKELQQMLNRKRSTPPDCQHRIVNL